MELYKLKEGALISQSTDKDLEIDGVLYSPVPESILRANGWKDLIKATIEPPLEWYEQLVYGYLENENAIVESYTIEANSNIRSIYSDMILNELNRALENDFTWGGHVVKLTESNQKDYLAGFTLANANPAMYIPMQYTFKDNVKHIMATLEESTNFTTQAFYFVSVTLETYRTERDKVALMSDSELYDYVKAL